MGPHGTPTDASLLIQVSDGACRNAPVIADTSWERFFTRTVLVANLGSSASAFKPEAAQNRRN
jgi:hypothetical protein